MNSKSSFGLYFGIFMVIVYVAVGVLCILDIFNFGNAGISLALGILLIVYGIWRGYRLYAATKQQES